MTDPVPAPAVELERPPHGGSFIRQANGSLQVVESAMPKSAPAETEPVPATLSEGGDLTPITMAAAVDQQEG